MLVSGLRIQTTNQEQYAELQTERLLHVLKDRLLQVSEVSAFFFFFLTLSFSPCICRAMKLRKYICTQKLISQVTNF